MPLVTLLTHSLKPLVDLVYPPRCPACGDAIADQHGLCVACWSMLEIPDCAVGAHATVPVHAATLYNDTSRRLVLAYKHGGRIALARLLAQLMAARLRDAQEFATPPMLVPVPLHRWRLWHRGFNQAALLANELARLGKGTVLVDALERRKRTPSLGGLGREAREAALMGAIRLKPVRSAQMAGRDVIIVDDVFTSGATTRACIAAIRHARPASIAVACFARVETSSNHHGDEMWLKHITPEAF